MKRWIIAILAALACSGGAIPGLAQQRPSAPVSVPRSGPIVHGRQLEPTVLGRVPPEELHPSRREEDELDALYRDVMARSAPARAPEAPDAVAPAAGSPAGR
jgi:hypothetical protein